MILRIFICLSIFCLCSQTSCVFGSEDNMAVTSKDRQVDSLFMEAVKWRIADNIDKAISFYELVIAIKPNYSAAYYGMAELKAEQRKMSEAIIYGEKAARLDPNNKWYKNLLSNLYEVTSQLPKAIDVLGQMRESDSLNLDLAYRQSRLYLAQGDIQGAIKIYDELEKMFEPNDEWSMQKYNLYIHVGNKKSAKEEIEKISMHIPGEAKYYEILAQMAMNENKYAEAYKYYKKILSLKPDDPYTYAALADYYRKTNQKDESLKALLKAVSQPNFDPETRINLVVTFFDKEETSNPTETELSLYNLLVDTLISMYPDMARLYYTKAVTYVRLKQYDLAYKAVDKCIQLDSTIYDANMLMVILKERNKDWEGVIEQMGKMIKRYPERASLYGYMTLFYNGLGMCDSAIKYGLQGLDKVRYVANSSQKQQKELMYGVVLECYSKEKNYKKSYLLLKQAMLDLPENAALKNNYAYLMAMQKKELDTALFIIEGLISSVPDKYIYWDTYAFLLFQKGMYSEAYVAIKNAIKMGGSGDPEVSEHYGDILYKTGKQKKAIYEWNKALTLFGDNLPEESVLKQKVKQKTWIESVVIE